MATDVLAQMSALDELVSRAARERAELDQARASLAGERDSLDKAVQDAHTVLKQIIKATAEAVKVRDGLVKQAFEELIQGEVDRQLEEFQREANRQTEKAAEIVGREIAGLSEAIRKTANRIQNADSMFAVGSVLNLAAALADQPGGMSRAAISARGHLDLEPGSDEEPPPGLRRPQGRPQGKRRKR